MFGVELGCFAGMVRRILMVAACRMCVMTGRFVIAGLMMLCGEAMVSCGMLVMVRCFAMMVRCLL
jgi:hypothetical protein